MRRARLACIVNLIVPGGGLILLRREWLGLAVAVLFAALAQTVIVGWWVAPLDVPRWMSAGGCVGAAVVWLHAQWLVWRRVQVGSSAALARELAAMRAQAAQALVQGDLAEAHRVLLVALNVDDEDSELTQLWARLMERMGRLDDARRGWRRVLALCATPEQQRAAREALAGLPRA